MICRKCKTILILDNNITNSRLNKKDYICSSCKKEIDAINYQKQKNHRLSKAKENYYKNPDKKKEYQKQYHFKNKDKILEKWKKQRLDNKKVRYCTSCNNQIDIKLREDNNFCSQSCKSKENRKNNYSNWKDNIAKYKKNKYNNDILFNLKERCRNRTSAFFKWQGKTKNQTTKDLIGCEWETLKQHIESQFIGGMSWENKELWHIDHIIPLASAETEKQLKVLCNYKNLQPLWAEDNLKKGSKHL